LKLVALALACALVATAHADPEADADAAFRAAEQHASAGDPHALDELEALGAARPTTRWTDDAWLEAGRLAERAGDYARARRDLEQALATTTDDQLARRAKGELSLVERAAGEGAEWSAVAAEHDRLEQRILAGGDPKPALTELEALVTKNPGYPRTALAMVLIAHARERDGDAASALAWLRRASPVAPASDRTYVRAELVRALLRAEQIDDARAELARIEAPPVAAELRGELSRAERRQLVRWLLWGLLAAIAVIAVIALRRAAGAWRAAGRRLVRPPAEALYFVPIAAVLVIVAATGNPLVARAVRTIAIAGAVVAWISGAVLDAVRARAGRVRFRRAALHAVIAALAVAAATYIAVDRDRMIDLVIETWHSGPQMR
jgi:predicted negative regulator of RcsB-dependent stress response